MGIREEVQTECMSLSISTVPGWNPVRPHRIINYKIAQKESGGDFDPYCWLSEANHMRPRWAKFESSLVRLGSYAYDCGCGGVSIPGLGSGPGPEHFRVPSLRQSPPVVAIVSQDPTNHASVLTVMDLLAQQTMK